MRLERKTGVGAHLGSAFAEGTGAELGFCILWSDGSVELCLDTPPQDDALSRVFVALDRDSPGRSAKIGQKQRVDGKLIIPWEEVVRTAKKQKFPVQVSILNAQIEGVNP